MSYSWAQGTLAGTSAAGTGNVGKIMGTVVNTAGQPIAFATVTLSAATGKPVDRAVYDEAGKFVLAHLAAGSYTQQVRFIGNQILAQTGLALTDVSNTLNMGLLTLHTTPARLGK